VQQVDEQRAEGLQALLAGRAQRDQGQIQRDTGVPADQQATQFVGFQFVGGDAGLAEVREQFALTQAGAVALVVLQIQLSGVGEELCDGVWR